MENIFTSLMYNVCCVCVCVLEVTLILLGPFLRKYMHIHTRTHNCYVHMKSLYLRKYINFKIYYIY